DDKSMYTVDSKTWAARPAQSLGGWRTADLANSNLLNVRKSVPFVRLLPSQDEVDDGRVQVYPNPITNDQFTVQFNLEGGKYRVEVKDALGRQVTQSQAAISGKGQTRTLNLPAATTKGFYLIKVIDEHNKTVYSKKVLVLEN
ncbi:MAG TPA: T9SS type A sorting domain-containing protein, partial [Chitinophagaceae bacterium]|nr:T9SS type A sorting domain-containing protein [Chitinophagaceae bacterium]